MSEKTLQQQVSEAKKLADKISGIIKKDWFTTNELVNKSNTGHEQAKQMLLHLGQYGLVKTESKDDKWKHKIVRETAERNELIQANIIILQNEIQQRQNRIGYLEELKKTVLTTLMTV